MRAKFRKANPITSQTAHFGALSALHCIALHCTAHGASEESSIDRRHSLENDCEFSTPKMMIVAEKFEWPLCSVQNKQSLLY